MDKGFQVKTALIRMENTYMLTQDICCNRHNDYCLTAVAVHNTQLFVGLFILTWL